ncbi:MAG: Rpn family recombination-promoting nuclease/putative transposase [Lachnospiraceae bacterium]|nr:Rpn family recombination-promoting nuclease/putative transposase [Lachnospiraceae bacterium]
MKRSRYYQAQMDVSLLEPGSIDFNKLNDTCFILVAPFDMFGRGLYRYTFEGVCRECPDLKLQDGATRIFINTKGTNRKDFSQEFLDFMDYITMSTDEVAQRAESEKIKLIHKRVREIRASEKMVGKYMQKWEEIELARQEGKEEGQEQGIEQGKMVGLIQGIKIFIRDKLLDQIAEDKIVSKLQQYFSLSEDEAEEYVKRIQQDIQKEMKVV